jgi:hypothetical protein
VNTLIVKMVKVIAENGNAQKATFFVLEDRLPLAYRSDLPELTVIRPPPPEVQKDEYVRLMVTAEYGNESSYDSSLLLCLTFCLYSVLLL